ncbi:hypothetical protein AB0C28_51670 [Nonomuraea sp. NPDC048892]|uniref:hypothetical protein n=1 Tax=Nonomuraea sp. NPDC048892 TaxID=3154624 RepID=UPI0033FF1A1A
MSSISAKPSPRQVFASQLANILTRAHISQVAFARRMARQLENDGHIPDQRRKNLAPRVHDWTAGVSLPARRWFPSLTSVVTELCKERGVSFSPGAFVSLWHMALAERSSVPVPKVRATQPPPVVRQAASLAPPLGRLPARVHGQDQIIEDLCDLLVRPDGRPHVVTGMGGCGKSTVALSVAARAVHAGKTVWWVAADASTLLESMLQIAFELGAPAAHLDDARAGRRSPADLLWSHLDRSGGTGWLLVLDGADSLEALATGRGKAADGAGWVRGGGAGLVLVTSRMRGRTAWGHLAARHAMSSLTPEAGAAVLLDLAPGAGSSASAQGLSARLGHLPLALVLAGRHLSSPFAVHGSFAAYTTALERNVSILDEQPTPAGLSILRTWEISLDELERQGHRASRLLLHLLAHFAPGTPLPVIVIELAADGLGLDSDQLRRTLQALHDMNLIEVHADPSPYGVGVTTHPLIAEVSRTQVQAAESRRVTATSIDVLTLALRHWDPHDGQHRPLLELLGAHAGALLRRLAPSRGDDLANGAVTPGLEPGRVLSAAGRIHEAAELVPVAAGLASRLDARSTVASYARQEAAHLYRLLAQIRILSEQSEDSDQTRLPPSGQVCLHAHQPP